MVFVVDDLAAWLVGLLADAGRKKLTSLVLGDAQERALQQAAVAAVQDTADELSPSDGQRAGQIAMVISEVFRAPVPEAPLAGVATLVEGLQAGIAGQLAVLDDVGLTGIWQSSAEVLGVPGSVLADRLTGHLVREIVLRGSRGGPLTPLADQLNHDLTHLQVRRVETMLVRLAGEIRDALVQPGGSAASAGRPLDEVTDPFALEVHRPAQPEDPQPGLPALPAYVPREHDAELGSVVRAAVEGGSGIAVLVGGSSTGKTRACWEALQLLRDRPTQWRLWHPIDPSRPDAALRELPAIGPRTVVWLNEAQFYLDVADGGLGERVAAGLRELLRDPARGPVLVLATLWPQFWDGLTASPAGDADPHNNARELLAGHDITVPAAFTKPQLQQLSQARDARLAQAAAGAQDGQVIQFLAGAPELLARYRNAPPAAAALIHTAMDARRLGMGIGLPQALLEAAAPGYLTDTEWDALGEDWLEQALEYVAVPCKGVRGPLTRIRPNPARSRAPGHGSQASGDQLIGGPAEPLYRLADYLDQYGRRRRKSQFPPATFWAAAADRAFPGDQAALGDAAQARGLYRDAAQLHKNAAARGNLHAVSYLAKRPHYLRADARPLHWAFAHASLDDLGAVASLLGSLHAAGAQAQAVALAERVAAHVSLDDLGAVASLLKELQAAGTAAQAVALAERAAAHASLDDPGAVVSLLGSLHAAGAQAQAVALAERAAAQAPLDDPGALARLLGRLRAAGATAQATALLHRDPAAHVSLADLGAVASLLDSLHAAGAQAQAVALAERAAAHVSLDDPGAVASLLDSLHAAGAQAQAVALAERAAAHAPLDDPGAVASLLGSLHAAGTAEQAVALAERAAAHAPLADPGAVGSLLKELQAAGTAEQAVALAERAAAHAPLDDPGAVASLLGSLHAAGAQAQAVALAERAAAQAPLDDPGALARLLGRLRAAGATAQATALLHRDPAAHVSLADHVSLIDAVAVVWLLGSLRAAGAAEQVTALAERAVAHVSLDHLRTVAWLLGSLRAAGAAAQATALAEHAAAHVSLDDPYAVAWLLGSLRAAGATAQATALLHRDPAAHVSLANPIGVAWLLSRLRTGAQAQATALLHRDPAAHVSLADLGAVGRLVKELRAAGTAEQAVALAQRAAAHAPLDDPRAVASLLDSLRAAGTAEQAVALVSRLPGAGMFKLFCEQEEDRQDRFRFGREADGSPAEPWGWEDLD